MLSNYALISSPKNQSYLLVKNWPDTSLISRTPLKNKLLIFVHPHCPCSMATINELERLLPIISDKTMVEVVFISPLKENLSWHEGRLFTHTKNIPKIKILIDRGYQETNHFKARTSGETFLYDQNGNLVFHGGITISRGHQGDSLGQKIIKDFVLNPPKKINQDIQTTNIYGCSLIEFESNRIAETTI